MKGLKLSLVIMAAALVTIGLNNTSYAFHDGGVAACESCHTMHNSSGGVAVLNKGGASQFHGVAYLLKGSDQSSTCLNCHGAGSTLSSYHVFTNPVPAAGTGPANFTPGGDFAWIGKSFGTSSSAKGERHGHNVIAADFISGPFGVVDPELSTAPGGTYDSNHLTCVSCHDPHPSARITTTGLQYAGYGKTVPPIYGYGSYPDNDPIDSTKGAVGVYRLLGGMNYRPFSYPTGPQFTTDPPVAVAPHTYNRDESATDTRVAYGSGMSEWCANCHTNIHTTNATGGSAPFIHPAGANALLTASANIGGDTSHTIKQIYNAYVKSGDLSGDGSHAYTSMVPYEEGTSDRHSLVAHAVNDGSVTGGPNGSTENVMCLSCHRAHASGFSSMTRWDTRGGFITSGGAYPTGTAPAMTQTEYLAAMYNRPATQYATYQRSLCNKCHAKD